MSENKNGAKVRSLGSVLKSCLVGYYFPKKRL